jgi:hypothetical protein
MNEAARSFSIYSIYNDGQKLLRERGDSAEGSKKSVRQKILAFLFSTSKHYKSKHYNKTCSR